MGSSNIEHNYIIRSLPRERPAKMEFLLDGAIEMRRRGFFEEKLKS
jgi:hypothetical protein